MSCDCKLPHGAVGWSAVCDCGISWSNSLTFYVLKPIYCILQQLNVTNYKHFKIIDVADLLQIQNYSFFSILHWSWKQNGNAEMQVSLVHYGWYQVRYCLTEPNKTMVWTLMKYSLTYFVLFGKRQFEIYVNYELLMGPRREKTCLQGFRQRKLKASLLSSPQLQRLGRNLKFWS